MKKGCREVREGYRMKGKKRRAKKEGQTAKGKWERQ